MKDEAAIIAGYKQRMALIHWWSEPSHGATTGAVFAVDPQAEASSEGPTRDKSSASNNWAPLAEQCCGFPVRENPDGSKSCVASGENWRAAAPPVEQERQELIDRLKALPRHFAHWNGAAMGWVKASDLWDALSASTSVVSPVEQERQEELRAAFEAGFQWCASGTDKFGDYNGGTIEAGFADFLAASPSVVSEPPRHEEEQEDFTRNGETEHHPANPSTASTSRGDL